MESQKLSQYRMINARDLSWQIPLAVIAAVLIMYGLYRISENTVNSDKEDRRQYRQARIDKAQTIELANGVKIKRDQNTKEIFSIDDGVHVYVNGSDTVLPSNQLGPLP